MRSEPVIVCRDCGFTVLRGTTHLACGCRRGFVAEWDQSLGEGRFLGRIVEPVAVNHDFVNHDLKEVSA